LPSADRLSDSARRAWLLTVSVHAFAVRRFGVEIASCRA
jgi:hypothetical protein